jgi:hypothetical protein
MRLRSKFAATGRPRGVALRAGALCALGIGAIATAAASSETGSAVQSLGDAWWTGPLLAPNAATMPQGHWLFEPYVYDLMPYGRFDGNGKLRSTGAGHNIGSQTYIEYGVGGGLTLGLIPRFGLHESGAGEDSSGLALGDITLQAAHGLTQFQQGSWIPASSLVIGETFPTGKYDRLDNGTDGALGSGAYATTLSLYSQTYLWMPNGRILRARLDVSYSISRRAPLRDQSIYGTSPGFSGHVRPGPTAVGDLAFEYSLTRSWVLATDIDWEHDGNTRVTGGYPSAAAAPVQSVRDFGSDELLYLAPAIEYNWSASMGVIAGARIAALGRNITATITPVAAINMYF